MQLTKSAGCEPNKYDYLDSKSLLKVMIQYLHNLPKSSQGANQRSLQVNIGVHIIPKSIIYSDFLPKQKV